VSEDLNEGGVGGKIGDGEVGHLVPKAFPFVFGEVAFEGLLVMTVDGFFQEAIFAGRGMIWIMAAVQQIILENLIHRAEGAVKGDQGESWQVGILVEIGLKGWQKFSGFHEGIVRGFGVWLGKGEFDMNQF